MFGPFQTTGEWFQAHQLLLEYILAINRRLSGRFEDSTDMTDAAPESYMPIPTSERFEKTLRYLEKELALDGNVLPDTLYERAVRKLGPALYGDRDFVVLWVDRIKAPHSARKKKGIIYVGDVFGHLTVVAFDEARVDPKKKMNIVGGRSRYWVCRCTCGNEGSWSTSDLRGGLRRSCGCMSRNRHGRGFKKGHQHGVKFHFKGAAPSPAPSPAPSQEQESPDSPLEV